ncbi:hypothetical protein ABFY09_09885 [Marinomonas sp. 5E14-1]|uniref:hypothetical protein n=1 Tax=Marinomonas sp. 5E14-1 TaxID=3153922 RepID=UPI0032661C5A
MKKLTAIAATFITASVLSTSAFASNDDSPREELRSAKVGVAALAVTLENLGQTVDTSVDLNGAHTFGQKEAAYNAKHAELQAQFDSLQLTSAE